MKVISWNMNYWQQPNTNNSAWKYIVEYINPDIALLQETVVPEEYKENVVFLPSCTARKNDPIKWGTCVYVGKNILQNGNIKNITNEYMDNDSYSGKQVFAEINITPEDKVIVCSLHTNTSPDGIYSIKSHIENIFNSKVLNKDLKNIIIGGDFNADSEMVNKYFKKTFDNIREVFHECEPEFTQTFFGANMNKENHYQDDHVFLSKDMSSCVEKVFTWNYGIIKNYSDHTILELEISL